MTKQKRATGSKAAARLNASREKALSTYVGFNVIRTIFATEADAREYMAALDQLGQLTSYTLYGVEMAPRLRANVNGTFEVFRG